MSYLRMYREKFVESNDLEYIYTNQSLKFVDYMEQVYLYKERIADNIFNKIADYDAFRDEIIMTMIGFFFKITLLVPAKRKVIANLKVKDFSDDFELLYHNGIKIKLPRALSQDIKRELEKKGKEICEENLFFELFCSCKYSENVFNTPFYYALRETGYDVPEDNI